MAKSNMALPVVCAVLGLHIITSIVFKSLKLNDMREANAEANNNDPAFDGKQVNPVIADVVLLVVAALCLLKCCSGKPTPGAMKGVCVVTAVLMLIRSFPDLLKGKGDSKDEPYARRLVYGITGLVNAVVAVTCCC